MFFVCNVDIFGNADIVGNVDIVGIVDIVHTVHIVDYTLLKQSGTRLSSIEAISKNTLNESLNQCP